MKNSLKLISIIAVVFVIAAFTLPTNNDAVNINANKSITVYPYCETGYATATKQGTSTPLNLWYHGAANGWYTNSGALENAVYDIYVCCDGTALFGLVDLTNQNHGIDTASATSETPCQ